MTISKTNQQRSSPAKRNRRMQTFKKGKDLFDILSDAIPEGIVVVNVDQKIVSLNSFAREMFGYESDELIGKSIEVLIPHPFQKSHQLYVSNYLASSMKRRMAEDRNLSGLRKNGEKFPVEVVLNPLTLGDKNYILALVVDISERQEIEESQKIRTAALEAAFNGILITDAQQKDNPVVYCNPTFEKITGYSSEEVLGTNPRFLHNHGEDQDQVEKMTHAIKNGEKCRVHVRNYKKDGTLFWNEVSITPIKDFKGKITHWVGIQNDITERKTQEEQISHLAQIFEDSLNEIYVSDAETLRIVNVNKGALKKIGYTLEECLKLTPVDLKPEFTEAKFRELIAPVIRDKSKKIDFETIHLRKDGSTYPVEVHMQGSTIGDRDMLIAIVLDISDKRNYTQKLERTVEKRTEELKEALEAEKELNELKTKFLSMVSHEFKTPLSGILTSATLVGKYIHTDQQDKRDKHLKTIASGVHQLTNILNDFLSLERLEKGKEVYRLTEFSLSKLLNEVVYNANMMLKIGQKINYPQNVDDIEIVQDEKILSLALSNLLYNSIKYSPENTTIDFEVQMTDQKIIFEIKDQGVGIPAKDQKHIFERYFRAENVILTQGTGIGLNIVKAHLENLGGTIYFESKENKGSIFTVEIPVSEPNEQ